jgi:hypothetical protein
MRVAAAKVTSVMGTVWLVCSQRVKKRFDRFHLAVPAESFPSNQ